MEAKDRAAIKELLDGLDDDKLTVLMYELRVASPDASPKKKRQNTNPTIWSKRPSVVHLTVHCQHCNHHYTTIKNIRDNDLIFYSTNRDGSVAKTKLLAEGETWVDTFTQCCNNCTRYIERLSLEELQLKYMELLLRGRKY